MILILFIFITIYWNVVNKKRGGVLKYTKITAILFFLLAGLRNEAFYSDTYGYVQNFSDVVNMTIPEIILRWPKDSFFYIFTHYLHPIIFHNYTLWFLLISALYIHPIYWLIKKYSPNPMISWWCFAFVGLMMFMMQGLRQIMAMGFVLNGFIFLLKEKPKYFFASVALAFLFHATSLISIIIYPLMKLHFKFSLRTISFYLVFLLVGLIYGTTMLKETTNILGQSDERFIGYNETLVGATWTYTLQQAVLVFPILYFLRKRFEEPIISVLSHITAIAFIIVSLSPIVAEMYRLSMYFSWAEILLFPIALDEAKKYGYKILQILFVAFALFYLLFIKTLQQEYLFFFQDSSNIIKQFYY